MITDKHLESWCYLLILYLLSDSLLNMVVWGYYYQVLGQWVYMTGSCVIKTSKN